MRFFLLGGVALMLLGGCGETTLSGGDTAETGNAVAGIIKEDGEPASGVIVTLYPENFNPVQDRVPDSTRKITNEQGEYLFHGPKPGFYNIQAFVPEGNAAVLIQGVNVPEGNDTIINAPVGSLSKPVSITIHTHELMVEEDGYVYIPGTGISIQITETQMRSEVITITALPTGVYEDVIYTSPDYSLVTSIIEQEFEIQPGEVAVIGPYHAWQDTLKLIIDTSPAGADVTEVLLDFPLLVRLDNSTGIFDRAAADGSDLRFVKGDGKTELAWEVESWDPAENSAVIWVKIDTVLGSNNSQFFYLYSGGPSYFLSDRGVVFDTDPGFTGVWHFNQDPGGTAPQFTDASRNGNHATGYGNMISENSVQALAGKGVTLDSQFIFSSNEYIDINEYTISIWFNTTSVEGGKLIGFSEGVDLHDRKHDRHIYMSVDGRLHYGVYAPKPDSIAPEDSGFVGQSGIRRIITAETFYNDGAWHHVTGTLSAAGQRLFVDGREIGHIPETVEGQSYTGFWRMGYDLMHSWNYRPSNEYFLGTLDEARVSHIARSAGWIKLCYENQKESSNTVKIE